MPGRVVTTATLPSAQTKEFSSRIQSPQPAAGSIRPMLQVGYRIRGGRVSLSQAILRETVEKNATKFDCNSYRARGTNEH
jgi:hypothetical protein